MELNDLILVSVDDHVVEPAGLFDNHLTKAQLAKAPKLIKESEEVEYWSFEGKKLPNIGLNAVVGRVPEEYGCEPTTYDHMRKGCYDIHARVEDMNVNGILGSICFGSFVGFEGSLFLSSEDKKNAFTLIQAYNDWHIDEWCGAYPGRFISLAILPCWDPQLMAQEIARLVGRPEESLPILQVADHGLVRLPRVLVLLDDGPTCARVEVHREDLQLLLQPIGEVHQHRSLGGRVHVVEVVLGTGAGLDGRGLARRDVVDQQRGDGVFRARLRIELRIVARADVGPAGDQMEGLHAAVVEAIEDNLARVRRPPHRPPLAKLLAVHPTGRSVMDVRIAVGRDIDGLLTSLAHQHEIPVTVVRFPRAVR